MLSESFVLAQLNKLPTKEQVVRLLEALNILKDNPHRSQTACIAMALSIPVFPKVAAIIDKNGYRVTLQFVHGETRMIDFQQFLSKEQKYDRVLLENVDQFNKLTVQNDTLVWPELGYWSKDDKGKDLFMYYDIDPALLYENSQVVGIEVPS